MTKDREAKSVDSGDADSGADSAKTARAECKCADLRAEFCV
ncbi:hypothetical protein [Helicobacter sp. CLO-3]|nr:hypothetical protein [Helicobacter sp. CLO-3]